MVSSVQSCMMHTLALWGAAVHSALSWLFVWIVSIWCLSLHAVAAGLSLGGGPLAGESGLAQDTVA